MKAFTDIEQSKKLAEFLPIESADMYYHNRVDIPDNFPLPIEWKHNNPLLSQEIPCWSLTALLAQMPCVELVSSMNNHYRAFWHDMYSEWHESAVDACYELILRERKEEEK